MKKKGIRVMKMIALAKYRVSVFDSPEMDWPQLD